MRLVAHVRAPVELAEAQVTVGDERPQNTAACWGGLR